ncbi:HAD family phosphatase [Tamlana fucoidanivorans]|uniref:HAD family phosphatase n=1 Tax=Allotamlana fucoidanivorans TaxID=2583814 RepID=A0A5C4SQQ9_9FLAO|nr:HAD family phosphatase [Tamlana fucoidanivorans]TNJ46534.1 HAD family phosphatase [Tamlana fucoidanivorans]
MKTINTIIFDLGGVLIDWNPEYVFIDVFNGDRDKMHWFLKHVCTPDWNENQDAGYTLEQATKDRITLFPEYENEIGAFYGRWPEMLGGAIEGSVSILNRLRESKHYKIIALTNWSAETFPIALKKFDFLQWFEGIVVSGEEKTRKPFDDIYKLTLQRYNINPEQALFIDDNLRNIEAAQALGIRSIHFKSPEQLLVALKHFNIHLQ